MRGTQQQAHCRPTCQEARPAPGCPSDASCAIRKPVEGGSGARQPTQRTRRAGQVGHPDCRSAAHGAGTPTRARCRTKEAPRRRGGARRDRSAAGRPRTVEHLIVPSATGTSSARTPAPGRPRRLNGQRAQTQAPCGRGGGQWPRQARNGPPRLRFDFPRLSCNIVVD